MSCRFFELGFDKYRYDFPLELWRFPIEVRKSIAEGYDAAELQQASRKRPTIYEKKLMTIKGRAYAKGLTVSISAQDLENELLKTHYCCPVTKERFTFSGGLLTDWSIDRVDNTRGYKPDNIVVVSAKANQAKSNLDLEQMIAVCFNTYPDTGDLEVIEWFRMVSFYYTRMKLSGAISFSQLLAKEEGRLEYFIFLQLTCANDDSSERLISLIRKRTEKRNLEALIKLGRKRLKKQGRFNRASLFGSDKLCSKFNPVIDQVKRHPEVFDHYLLDCMYR